MIHVAKIGDTLHMYDDQTAASLEKTLRRQAVRTGEAITWSDGTMEWYTWDTIVNTAESGSRQYTWDSTGNKVLHELVKHVKADGVITTTPGKRQFRNFDD